MGDISRSFEANQASTQIVNITATERFFTVTPVLDEYEGCDVQIGVNFPPTPTDSLVVSVYARQDGSNWDVVPLTKITIDKGNDPSRITFVIKDVYEFRVGVKRDGSTDTIPSADMSSRRWKWNSV